MYQVYGGEESQSKIIYVKKDYSCQERLFIHVKKDYSCQEKLFMSRKIIHVKKDLNTIFIETILK